MTLSLTPDELLTTTRTVRKRLDLTRPVPIDLVRECLQIALQAPSGSNAQAWHWVVVTDRAQRAAIGGSTGSKLSDTPSPGTSRAGCSPTGPTAPKCSTESVPASCGWATIWATCRCS